MPKIILSSFFCLLVVSAFGQYSDPNIPKPVSGYGSDGTHTVGVISFVNPAFPEKNIEIYYPSDVQTKVPTLFYSHAYGGNISANIIGMLRFVAKKGYAIIFVPYQTTGVTIPERYANLLNGFRQAAREHADIIDTTQVGFMGHSFGGGASFANAYTCFTENNWGKNGRFIYSLAPWYTFNISQDQLQAFPADTKLLMEVFDDDTTNDHRMAIDCFQNIGIPAAEKDYIRLKSDTISGYVYVADHVVPNTVSAFNALDYYAIYRFLDALCDYTFHGNSVGKSVALGNGSAAQISMPGGLKNLEETDNPTPLYPEDKYMFPCSAAENLRATYCPGFATGVSERSLKKPLRLYPNPVSGILTIEIPENRQNTAVKLFSAEGRLLHCLANGERQIDMSVYPKGLYWLIVGDDAAKFVKD